MKILTLTTSFPKFTQDSDGSFIFASLKINATNDQEYTVICPDHLGTKPLKFKNIKTFRFKYFVPPSWQVLAYGDGINSNLKKYFWAKLEIAPFMLAFLIKGLFYAKNADVIHAHWTLAGFVGVILKRFYKKPLVLTVHGSDINLLPSKGLIRFVTISVLKKCDQIITVSKSLKEKVVDLGISKEKVCVIPNGIKLADFNSFSLGANLLNIGGLIEVKGHIHLIAAMVEVIKYFPKTKLFIAGEGMLREKLAGQIKNLKLSKNVFLVGQVDKQKIPQFLKKGKIFIMPSFSEGMPLSLLEAMASEKAVVASNVGGIPEIIANGKNGILVESHSTEVLIKAILMLLKNKETQKKFGENARKTVLKNYDIRKSAEKNVIIYKNLIKYN